MTKLRVSIVDEWLPFPIDCGKKLRSYHLLTPLASEHQITYLAPRSGCQQIDQQAEDELRRCGMEVVWIEQRVPENSGALFFPRLAANLLSPAPYSVQRHRNTSMQEAVARMDKDNLVDLWHVEWTPYLENIRGRVSKPIVIDAHNVESLIWQRHWELERNPVKKWYIRQQWKKFQDFERDAFKQADCVITTTECDAEMARRDFGASKVKVVSNGVDLNNFHYVESGRDPFELLFLGSLAWRPNLDAVDQLLNAIFPAILKVEPRAHLTIVGASPPSSLVERVRNAQRVALHADVPDVRPYYQRCGALLTPLRIGGGSRIKILEALASGCPVISTAVGAEGLHLRPDVDFRLVSRIDDFPQITVDAIRNYGNLQETAASGHRIVRDRYGWNMLSQELHAIWDAQIRTRKVAVA